MTEPIIQTESLTRFFGGFKAVDGVSLSIPRGSIRALIGPNGAGKTTCFNLLTKFLPPSSGRILFDGEDITNTRAVDIANRGLVRSFQISSVFGTLTALENVRGALQRKRGNSFDFWRSSEDLRRYEEQAMVSLETVGLAADAHTQASTLSYGKKRALEIATTIALEPKVLLLDEPTAGMGREDIDTIVGLIRKVAVGRTVLMVEHNLAVVATLAHTITVLARGKILAEGDYATVSRDPRVIEAYIGRRA